MQSDKAGTAPAFPADHPAGAKADRAMFRPEWLQGSRVSVFILAYLSAGKVPVHTKIIDDPELTRHRILKSAIDDGDLKSCGELGRYLPKPSVAHGGSLIRFHDLAEYAKTVSFDWLNNVLKLWEAVRAGAPQDELEEMFSFFRAKPKKAAARQPVNRADLKRFMEKRIADLKEAGERSTARQDEAAARAHFKDRSINREWIKHLRQECNVPEKWTKRGRRN